MASGVGCIVNDRASFFLEIIARLGRQTQVAFLTGAYDQEIGVILIDKFRLLFGDDQRVRRGLDRGRRELGMPQ